MAKVSKEIRKDVELKSLREIEIALLAKQKLVYDRWQRNEAIYYMVTNWDSANPVPYWNSTKRAIEWKAPRVDLGKGIGFVQTLLSKIDTDSMFKYEYTDIADISKANDLNAIKDQDSNMDDWEFKKRAARKTALIYGRLIYEYFATGGQAKGAEYKSNLNVIHPYNFLVDPACGGLNVQDALYCGHYAGFVTLKELTDGVKEGVYNREDVKRLIGEGKNMQGFTTISDIDQLKQFKFDVNSLDQTDINAEKSEDTVQMWKWYTTYKGERYYCYINKETGVSVRVEKLTDLYPASAKIDKRGLFPYATGATDPEIDIFFSMSPLDQVAAVFIMQNVVIEQMIENYFKINKPQKFVSVIAGESFNPTDLLYSPDKISIITNKVGTTPRPIDQVIQTSKTVEITTSAITYDKLDMISASQSAYTPGAQGVSDDDKVGVYEGNQANVADRYSLLDKNLSKSEKELAVLHYCGIIDHMSANYAVSYIGSEGFTVSKMIKNAKKLESKSGRYNWKVSSSSAETNSDKRLRADKLSFVRENMQSFKNPEMAIEIAGRAVGLTNDEIKGLTSEAKEVTLQVIGEAFDDFEMVTQGKMKLPPVYIDGSYLKALQFYYKLYGQGMTPLELKRLDEYSTKVTMEISQNEIREGLMQGEQQVTGEVEEEVPPEQPQGLEEVMPMAQ